MSKSDWVTTGVICQQLGISDKHLWRLRDEKLLRKNHHWKNIARPQAARPTYRWHLKRCEQALEIDPELRGFITQPARPKQP
ncbi:DNA-binding protein [Oscillatoria sp. FACHB-1407]|uniref:DNA-binding protein n=1 Tax=Oscillatoria sp. FACHB-1407 TaxID=2692847 RepID=UPI0016868D3A|nr:DNA-binding protein [Oscillatoria sp. FACHB-1407]MBD2465760.1 DNA-binding protein [Oscillatoria sp. FACHB-1407]